MLSRFLIRFNFGYFATCSNNLGQLSSCDYCACRSTLIRATSASRRLCSCLGPRVVLMMSATAFAAVMFPSCAARPVSLLVLTGRTITGALMIGLALSCAWRGYSCDCSRRDQAFSSWELEEQALCIAGGQQRQSGRLQSFETRSKELKFSA